MEQAEKRNLFPIPSAPTVPPMELMMLLEALHGLFGLPSCREPKLWRHTQSSTCYMSNGGNDRCNITGIWHVTRTTVSTIEAMLQGP